MKHLFYTSIGRLRIIALLEGLSLLILVFIAAPLKHLAGTADLSAVMGPVHGALFLLFVFSTISVGIEQHWKFNTTTWKVLLASLIPFGTFYIDRKILSKIPLH